jgi:hypothetical protein
MKIRVTQEHINQGVKFHAGKCPVALACREATGQPHVVSRDEIIVLTSPMIRHKTPADVGAFIYAFDHSRLVQPLEFELED